MKKREKIPNTKRKSVIFIILALFLIGALLLTRAYFLNKPIGSNINILNLKYNEPLEISNLPKFNTTTDINIFPKSEFEYTSNSSEQWLELETENGIQVGVLKQDLSFDQVHFLPQNTVEIKLFEDNKIFFILEAKDGFGPKLVFKDKSNIVEVIELKSNEFFTGYYYSSSEQTFYISKGDSTGKYTLFTLNPNAQLNTLLELTTQFEIIKSFYNEAAIKQSGNCKFLTYSTKTLTDAKCSEIYLNSQNLNLITTPSNISINQNKAQKSLVTAASSESISSPTLKSGEVLYFIYKLQEDNTSEPSQINSVDLTGKINEITNIFPNGEIQLLFKLNNQLIAIVKNEGIKRLLKFNPETITSYPQDSWSEVIFTEDVLINIGILGVGYKI